MPRPKVSKESNHSAMKSPRKGKTLLSVSSPLFQQLNMKEQEDSMLKTLNNIKRDFEELQSKIKVMGDTFDTGFKNEQTQFIDYFSNRIENEKNSVINEMKAEQNRCLQGINSGLETEGSPLYQLRTDLSTINKQMEEIKQSVLALTQASNQNVDLLQKQQAFCDDLKKSLEELKAERKADTHELETLKRSIAELTNASSEPPQNRSHTVGVVGAYEGAGRIQEQANLTAETSAKRKPTSQEASTTSTSMCLSPTPARPVKQYKCANPGCNVSMNDRSNMHKHRLLHCKFRSNQNASSNDDRPDKPTPLYTCSNPGCVVQMRDRSNLSKHSKNNCPNRTEATSSKSLK